MPQTDNSIFELDDDATRRPVSYEYRLGIAEHAAIASELVGIES